MQTHKPNVPMFSALDVQKDKLKELTYTKVCEKFLHIPALAVKSELVRVQPIRIGSSQSWTPALNMFILEACESFSFMFKGKCFNNLAVLILFLFTF